MRFARYGSVLVILILLAGCGDNMFPSSEDKRPAVQAGSTGPSVSQKAPDFSVSDTNSNIVNLTSALANKKGIVLYFTMWCPICDTHMSHIRGIIPSFPAVGFYLVDYVSGTVTDAANATSANGYAGGSFITLADIGNSLLQGYQATMGTTVVIDNNGIVRMNEDFRDGSRLNAVLARLP